MNKMNQAQVIRQFDEMVVITPQILRFRPKNQLIISCLRCFNRSAEHFAQVLDTPDTPDTSDSIQALKFLRFDCQSCGEAALHAIGPIFCVDLTQCSGEKLTALIQRKMSNERLSFVSIDWYCEDLSTPFAHPQLVHEIRCLIDFIKDLRKRSIIRAHFSDYSKVIPASVLFTAAPDQIAADSLVSAQDKCCGEFADVVDSGVVARNSVEQRLKSEHFRIWDYVDLERESVIGKYLAQGVQSLAAENQLVATRITDESICELIAVKMCTEKALSKSNAADYTFCAQGVIEWNQIFASMDDSVSHNTLHNTAVLAKLLLSCEQIEIRDAILLFAINPESSEIVLENVSRASSCLEKASQIKPDFARITQIIKQLAAVAIYSVDTNVALYAAIAYLYWWCDQPAAALENARYALSFCAEYSLAKLIQRAVTLEVAPPWKTEQNCTSEFLQVS